METVDKVCVAILVVGIIASLVFIYWLVKE